MDPIRHVDCISRKLNRIHDVKQHLARQHTVGFYCRKCFEGFSSDRLFKKHLHSVFCEPREAPSNVEYVSNKAQDLLTRRVDRTLEGKEQWYIIWNILFEDQDKTRNPYLGSLVEEAIDITRTYLKKEGSAVISKVLQRNEQLIGGDCSYGQLFFQLLDAARDNVEQKPRESNSTRIVDTSTGDNPINSVTETRQKLKHDSTPCIPTTMPNDHQCRIRQPESTPPSPPVLSRSSTYVSEVATTPQLCSAPDIPTVYGFQNGNFQMPLDEVMRELGSTTSSGRMHYFNPELPDFSSDAKWPDCFIEHDLYTSDETMSFLKDELLQISLPPESDPSDKSLATFIDSLFPKREYPNLSREHDVTSATKVNVSSVTARRLNKIAKLDIIPTDDLTSHLLLDSKNGTVSIVHYTSVLKQSLGNDDRNSEAVAAPANIRSNIPSQLAIEALATIKEVLFPDDEIPQSMLRNLISKDKFDPDIVRIVDLPHLCGTDERTKYQYWGSRLLELYDELENPTPRGFLEEWLERKSGARYAMMVTLIGLFIVILLGTLSLGISIFQAWVGWQQWQHPVS
ncbi:hypothetical protein EDB81DRAFT_891173 [Dactylonectria macrodidyma]|uniref:C2H2-type domain-containing protein n=1 Tax=Dactylonectria macrodidyma TaxID=307937 RepID=A0A9P9DMI9_9HYPO|nr:hypothetical protein EDB81DRAFT_891173 [Dactylonectria macrodidyma]